MDERLKRIVELNKFWKRSNVNYLHPKDGSWKYWRYRVLRPMLKLKYKMYRKPVDSTPWLSPTSIEFFKEYLNGTQTGAEFGSGSSTVFFAPRLKHFVSVEHYKPWFDKVIGLLSERNIPNVDYLFIEKQEPDSTLDTEQMFPQITGLEGYEYRKDYINYFQALSTYPDEHFDFILVDGRARPECVFSSISKLKKGGLMILDNSERKRYEVVFNHLKNWEMMNTTNGLTDTTFWVKP